jgi:hypothetical protein
MCCLAATGSALKMRMGEKIVFSRLALAEGAAEYAVVQAVHFADSLPFE